jgi:hypothetical protein
MSDELIPFGKHKGKPLEILAADKEYTDWLIQQDWFRSKYQSLYTIVINNFQQPTETPEHNSLQGQFVDDKFCLAFYEKIFPLHIKEKPERTFDAEFDNRKITVKVINPTGEKFVWNKNFEKGGVDVSFSVGLEYEEIVEMWDKETSKSVRVDHIDPTYFGPELRIEIKPSVSDDYPSVLRQAQTLNCNCLYLREYTGKGVDEQTFVKIFETQRVKVIFQRDIKIDFKTIDL